MQCTAIWFSPSLILNIWSSDYWQQKRFPINPFTSASHFTHAAVWSVQSLLWGAMNWRKCSIRHLTLTLFVTFYFIPSTRIRQWIWFTWHNILGSFWGISTFWWYWYAWGFGHLAFFSSWPHWKNIHICQIMSGYVYHLHVLRAPLLESAV